MIDWVIDGVRDWALGLLAEAVCYMLFWPGISSCDLLRQAGCPKFLADYGSCTLTWLYWLLVVRFVVRRFQPGFTFFPKPDDLK